MARIVNGILTVDAFTPTGNPGEYTFENATFASQSDMTGNGAYLLTVPGFVIYVPTSDPNTFLQIPGVVHRYKLTQLTITDSATISGTMLWDEEGPELDTPTNGIDNIIAMSTPNRALGLPVDPSVYPTLAAGSTTGAYNVDTDYILDLDDEALSADPTSPYAGQIWFNTTDNVYRGFNGTTVVTLATGTDPSVLSTLSTIETSVGLNEDGTYTAPSGTNYIGNSTSVVDAIVELDTQIGSNAEQIQTLADEVASIQTNSDGAVATVQTALTAVENAVGLTSQGAYIVPTTSNYLNASTSVMNAVLTLDTLIKTNTTNVAGKVSKAGDTLTGTLTFTNSGTVTGLPTPVNATDAATKQYVDAALSGLTWIAPVRNVVAGLATYSEALNVGDRLIDTTTNDIYTVTTAGSNGATAVFGPGVAPTATDAVFTSDGEIGYVYNGITWVQFTGSGQIAVGAGMAKNGNLISINLGAALSIDQLNNLEVVVNPVGGLMLTEDGSTPSTSSSAQLGILLADSTLSVSSAGLKLAAGGVTGTQLASSVAGMGLTGGAGQPLAVDIGPGIKVVDNQLYLDTSVTDARYVQLAGSTMTGLLVLSADPTAPLGAVTKQYVDNAVNTAGSYVQKSGSTMTGPLILNEDPTEPLQAATKEYVDNAVNTAASYVEISGSTMTGPLILSEDPTEPLQAATKEYVDAIATANPGGAYVYQAPSAMLTHVVTHNLNSEFVGVTVVNAANNEVIIPDSITYNTTEQLTVTFLEAVQAIVVCTGGTVNSVATADVVSALPGSGSAGQLVYLTTGTIGLYVYNGTSWLLCVSNVSSLNNDAGYITAASPNLTGTPTAPTATAGTNTTQLATCAFVHAAFSSLSGGITYVGTWNASTNTPTITSSTGTAGQLYKVSVAGTTTVNGVSTWSIGDMLLFDGTTWDKIDGQPTEVLSFNNRVGPISLTSADITGVNGALTNAANTWTGAQNMTGATLTVATQTLGDNSNNAADTSYVYTATQGSVPITLASSNVTLNAQQYSTPIIILSGTLTANVVLTFPLSGSWAIYNGTTGNFTVTLTNGNATCVAPQGLTIGVASLDTAGMAILTNPAAGVSTFNLRAGAVTLQSSDITGAGGALAASPTLTGRAQVPASSFAVNQLGNVTGTISLDLSQYTQFTFTCTGNTTIGFANAPASGFSEVALIRMTNGGAYTVSWPSGTQFAGGTVPEYSTSGTDLLAAIYDVVSSTYWVFEVGLAVAV